MNWKLTFEVKGYDDEFVILVSRSFSQRRASKIAAQRLSFETKARKHRIILTRIIKEEA